MSNYWFLSAQRQHSKFVLITFILTFAVIILGAYTRLTDAGLSCPDWPNCFGYITAPHTSAQLKGAALHYPFVQVDIKRAWTEMIHRYLAGSAGILILIFAFRLLFSGTKNFKNNLIAIVLITLLSTQVILGMLTVTVKLKPIIVLAHLLTGLSLLSVLWWAYLNYYPKQSPFYQRGMSLHAPWLWLGIIILSLQIALGGWVSTHHAGLACIDFPYCNGSLLPSLSLTDLNTDLITIHMLHRIGALLTAGYFICLAWALSKNHDSKKLAFFIFALIGLQLILGVLNIVWLRPVWIAIIHQFVGALLLLATFTAFTKNVSTSPTYGF